jgi:hypothetical protein
MQHSQRLNDKILAVQSIIVVLTLMQDSIVNTVAELLAVFSTYTEDQLSYAIGRKSKHYRRLQCSWQMLVGKKAVDARQGKKY